jgi:hypothetical protein
MRTHQFRISLKPPLGPELLDIVSKDRSVAVKHPSVHRNLDTTRIVLSTNLDTFRRCLAVDAQSDCRAYPHGFLQTGLEIRQSLGFGIRHDLGELPGFLGFIDFLCKLGVRFRIIQNEVEERLHS